MGTLSLQHARLQLFVQENGTGLMLVDPVRGTCWTGDPGWEALSRTGGVAWKAGDALSLEYPLANGAVHYTLRLLDDCVEVTMTITGEAESQRMPALLPESERADIILPRYQGLLQRPTGRDVPAREHFLQMNVLAALGARGALLAILETETNCSLMQGEDAGRGPFAYFLPTRCQVHGWFPRVMRLYPVDANITAVARRYRQRVIERGEFVSWDEKIARKPVVGKLFGAIFAFLGYNSTGAVDYAASAQRLRDYGFETVFYYPLRMCQRTLDFTMGGDAPIWLSDDELARLHQVDGALLAPWAWEIEWLDDGSEDARHGLAADEHGAFVPHWQIDDQHWYRVCLPYEVAQMQARFAGDMHAMDWVHYDVNAGYHGVPCFRADHNLHGGEPIGAQEGLAATRALFGAETNGNRIVSSETFTSWYAPTYDIGASMKLHAAGGRHAFLPIPFSGLVFHDSCLHNWWELFVYNELPSFNCEVYEGEPGMMTGAGMATTKAITDALYGCAPQIMPFGKQYYWTDIATRRTASFLVTLDDPEVQRVLPAALRVAQLHRRIGKCEMLSFEFLSDDCTIQSTVFGNGTRIVANLSDLAQETDYGRLEGNRWLELPAR